MKPFYIHLLTLLALLAASCGNPAKYTPEDFTTEVYTPRHATGFTIRGMQDDSSTLITVRNPWQGASGVEQYLLVMRGDKKTPADFVGQRVEAPARRVVCMSSSHVALFDATGEVHRIKGVSGIDYISNPYIATHRLCGEIRDIGYDTNIDFELLASIRPDIILLYGVTGETAIVTGKLRELGIPYIYIGDYMEQSPLGKAEWLLVAAELCGCRERGEEVFAGIAARYEALRRQIAADSTTARPTVMLNTPYRDTWFMPSSRSYMIRLVEDAGGRYIYTKNDSDTSVAIDMEEAYLLASSADVWLNVGACTSLQELKSQNPKFAAIPAVRNLRVWNNNRRRTQAGGSDFWESGAVRPDLILRDLQTIFRNGADSTFYYQRLE